MRGFGKSEGRSTEETMFADAHLLLRKFALYELDNMARVANTQIPGLFFLGSKDHLMPTEVSENLFRHYACPKRCLIYEASHNDLLMNRDVYKAMQSFLQRIVTVLL